jgi:hypothetical protein
MRAIVIYTCEKPVDVIHVPQDVTVMQLQEQTARLDAVGVDYELLNFTLNEEPDDLALDIERFARDDGLDLPDTDGEVPEEASEPTSP